LTRAPAIKIPTAEGRIDDREDDTHLRALWREDALCGGTPLPPLRWLQRWKVLLGYLGLGGGLSILANKMARRAG
jgi:hypothetical protein